MSSQGGSNEGVTWECPICLHVPSSEIYQCTNGHSICSFCVNQLEYCPSCRIEIGEQKIRNLGLEEMLDSLKLKCSWNGCTEELCRSEVSEHQETCPHNPDGLKICHLFSTSFKTCDFQFTLESLQDPLQVEQVLSHLTSIHEIQEANIPLDTPMGTPIRLECLKSQCPDYPGKYLPGNFFIRRIITLEIGNRNHLFLYLTRVHLDDTEQEMVSFMLVQLTPDFEVENNSTLKLNLFIESVPKEGGAQIWDQASMGRISWTTRPMKIDQFITDCKTSSDEQFVFPFPLPINYLEKHYAGPNGEIKSGFLITVL